MPPDAAPPPGAGNHPGVPAGTPEPPEKTREINWTAVGSLAAVAAAVIAFLAYALPAGSTPDPTPPRPSPTVSRSTPLPTVSTSASATTLPPSPSPTLTIAQSSGPPAGCQQADAAIATFNKLAGPTWPSRLNAADQMGQGLAPAVSAAGDSGNSAVSADVQALAQDANALEGYALGHDGSDYNAALTTTSMHIQALNTVCGTG